MEDADFQIRGGGKGGHPDPEMGAGGGEAISKKKFFSAVRAPTLAPPLVDACSSLVISFDEQLPKTAEH